MHPLHQHIAAQIAEILMEKRVVVWYDEHREFTQFISEISGDQEIYGIVSQVSVAGVSVHLIEYDGSFFAVRMAMEPYVNSDMPEPTLIYIPGAEKDIQGSVLMELEKAGDCYEPQFGKVARTLLRQRYTEGVIDEILNSQLNTYQDIARALSDSTSTEPPSMLKAIFSEAFGNEAILIAWLANDSRDAEIESKDAIPELRKLIQSWLGLELPDGAALGKLRAITNRYVLWGEFISDLRCPVPAVLAAVPAPKTEEQKEAVREVASKLRGTYPNEYASLANRVEVELNLPSVHIPADALGSIDTFSFEERSLLGYCGSRIAGYHFDEALAIVSEHENNFWLDRDVGRKAHWVACRRMAELGKAAEMVRTAVKDMRDVPAEWVEAYTQSDGWYHLDQAQRRLETWVVTLEEEPDEHPLAVVRRAYEDTCQLMAEGFTKAMVKSNWTGYAAMPQSSIYNEIVAGRPKPVAYFLIDAMRYEMGLELVERLPEKAEVKVSHAVGVLPSITSIGMAALLQGASASFNVVESNGRLGALIDGSYLPDLAARKKYALARDPALIDLSLDELLSLQPSRLRGKIRDAQVIMIRSQEIDSAGETGFTFHARRIMDTVIDNIARAIRKLAAEGIQNVVVTADHGHLFFALDRDESMRMESPGGKQVELHRRCWIGQGGSTPHGSVRVTAMSLGYESKLDFVFPCGCSVFKAGGDLAYHHGGLSLQELVIPVLTVRLPAKEVLQPFVRKVTVSGLPDAITNRIFSVTLQLGVSDLFTQEEVKAVRPILMAGGKQVGAVGMVTDARFDPATGYVHIQANKTATVAFLLNDDTVPALRVVVQDPATDAELYRSPAEIPLRLGV